MEIVTEPEMKDGKEASAFVKQLIRVLQALGVSDGRLEGENAANYGVTSVPQWGPSYFDQA